MKHPALDAFVVGVAPMGLVSDVWCYGSLATGDHRPGVSDIDLVALTTRPPERDDVRLLSSLHRSIDSTVGKGDALGCAYVTATQLHEAQALHPTWTHGHMVSRRLSSMVHAELLTHGRAVLGREPDGVLHPMSDADIRSAALEELSGYWSWAVRRPWLFLSAPHADLALLSMARVRHTLATGELISKTLAISQVRAPHGIVEGVRQRRESQVGASTLSPRLARHAWLDTHRTITQHRARFAPCPPSLSP